jgi:hypothetical protein
MQRIVTRDGSDFRKRLGNPLAGQATGTPPEATATEAPGERPITGLAHHVTG